jgi:anti-anti-sigma factor
MMGPDPRAPAPFECHVEPDRDLVWIRPVGELDIATVGEVQAQLEELRDAGFDRLVLDLRQTTFIDSSGLHLAVHWHRRSRREHFDFAIAQGPKPVRRILEATGLDARLRFIDAD